MDEIATLHFQDAFLCETSMPQSFTYSLSKPRLTPWLLYNQKSQSEMVKYNFDLIKLFNNAPDNFTPEQKVFYDLMINSMVEMAITNLAYCDLIKICDIPEVKADPTIKTSQYFHKLFPEGFFAIIKPGQVKNIIEVSTASCQNEHLPCFYKTVQRFLEKMHTGNNINNPHAVLYEKNPVRILYNFFSEVAYGMAFVPALNIQKALSLVFPTEKYLLCDLISFQMAMDHTGKFQPQIDKAFCCTTYNEDSTYKYIEKPLYTLAYNKFSDILKKYNISVKYHTTWPMGTPDVTEFGTNIDDIHLEPPVQQTIAWS